MFVEKGVKMFGELRKSDMFPLCWPQSSLRIVLSSLHVTPAELSLLLHPIMLQTCHPYRGSGQIRGGGL
jgi:hypothetical protein